MHVFIMSHSEPGPGLTIHHRPFLHLVCARNPGVWLCLWQLWCVPGPLVQGSILYPSRMLFMTKLCGFMTLSLIKRNDRGSVRFTIATRLSSQQHLQRHSGHAYGILMGSKGPVWWTGHETSAHCTVRDASMMVAKLCSCTFDRQVLQMK